MTINEAIENLDAIIETGKYEGEPSDTPAIKLGIEALKRCRTLAQESKFWALHPLPGETKD